MGHVFIIHFAVGHLRRRHFPMDPAVFTGHAGMGAMAAEKGAWIDRLKQEGRLDSLTPTGGAPTPARVAAYTVGFLAIGAGLYILAGGLINAGQIRLNRFFWL